MKLNLDKWSLVIRGQWNTAILSPDWLAKEVFKKQELHIKYPVLGNTPPIFEASNMKIVAGKNSLVIAPTKNDEGLLQQIEDAAIHVLKTLPYTPVSAFGENFHYETQSVPAEIETILARISQIQVSHLRLI